MFSTRSIIHIILALCCLTESIGLVRQAEPVHLSMSDDFGITVILGTPDVVVFRCDNKTVRPSWQSNGREAGSSPGVFDITGKISSIREFAAKSCSLPDICADEIPIAHLERPDRSRAPPVS